ncbi:hypothetical protein BGW38_005312 [Lunasporangiospora selenospora]|uniref:PROP1-like PPR domain-containing protein n=1 Tax=Lunasporangiospora selenospora TaxID=979761 RepID=A0A9P6G1U7_9FUNG|nr:hypothetical protein BGW38_005312 [Lunasporangiospora selenospora]
MSEYKHLKRSVDMAMSLSRSNPRACQALLASRILSGNTTKVHFSSGHGATSVHAVSPQPEAVSRKLSKPIPLACLPVIFANPSRSSHLHLPRHQAAKTRMTLGRTRCHSSRAFHGTASGSSTLDQDNSSASRHDPATITTLKQFTGRRRPTATTFESQELQLDFPVPHSADAALAISNLRLLIHSESTSAPHSSPGSHEYRQGLITEQRTPSSIAPPSSALCLLFTHIQEAGNLHLLSEADWEALISWFFIYEEYQMLDRIHLLVLDQQDISAKCNTPSFVQLVRASLRMREDSTATNLFGAERNNLENVSKPASETTKFSLLQRTLLRMNELGLPPSEEFYGLWLRAAVREEDWNAGIGAWKSLNLQTPRSSPSLPLTSLAIICYFHRGNYNEAGRLLKTVLEKCTATQHKQNYAMFTDNGVLVGSSAGTNEGDEETSAADGRIEFLTRQKQSTKNATLLVEKMKADRQNTSTTNNTSPKSREWMVVAFPALIEAMSLDKKDALSAKLAMEMTELLSKHGFEMDKTRFRMLCRYIGATLSSKEAEMFLKRWLETSRSTFSATSSQPLPGDDDTLGTENTSNESRKSHRIHNHESRTLAEAGLQEVLKQAVVEGEFTRVRKILEGMSLLDMDLGAATSTKVLNGLCDGQDYRTAMITLEKIIQEKRVPSVYSANKLMNGLIRSDRLDESVAMFRDLTENHGIQPSADMLRNLMSLTAKYGRLPMTQRILSALKHKGVQRDGRIYCNLMRCYIRDNNVQGAIKVFENMESIGVRNETSHFNVLLEGAIRGSSPLTALGILEIMSSQRVHPNAETWNILLGGAFISGNRVLSHQIFHELSRSVAEGIDDTSDPTLRASRHPETFQLLMREYAERQGIDSALELLKSAQDAGYAPSVKASMFRDLMERSCQEGNGVAGYELYKLLRQIDGSDNSYIQSPTQEENYWASLAPPAPPRRAVIPAYSAMSITSTSSTVTPIPLANLYSRILDQLDQGNKLELGREMATDLILSGFDMDQGLVQRAIGFYARCGELPAAFGLFMRMGRAYGVEPTRVMVKSLYAAACDHGLLESVHTPSSEQIGSPDAWDEASAQQWLRVLKASMENFGIGIEA